MHNVHESKIWRISANPHAVNIYLPAEDRLLVDAEAFFRLVIRDVARELQAMPEGMRQAVMLAAVSTDDYHRMAVRLKVNLGSSDLDCLAGGNVFVHNLPVSECIDRVCRMKWP